jgi:cell division septum initiation protein DivIVA
MAGSNVDRLREAVQRVEGLLSEFDDRTPIEVWTEPPPEPPGASRGGAKSEVRSFTAAPGVTNRLLAKAAAAELRVAAATDVAQTLTDARVVAEQLLDEERRTAEAVVRAARQLAEVLHTEKRRTAEAMVSAARQVAEQLEDEDQHTAAAMVALAQEVALELRAQKRRTAEAMVTEAQHVAERHAAKRLTQNSPRPADPTA